MPTIDELWVFMGLSLSTNAVPYQKVEYMNMKMKTATSRRRRVGAVRPRLDTQAWAAAGAGAAGDDKTRQDAF